MFRLAVVLFALTLTACQTARGTRDGAAWPYPDAPAPSTRPATPAPYVRSASTEVAMNKPDATTPETPVPASPSSPVLVPEYKPLPDYPRSAEAISSPAVMALIRQSRTERRTGKLVQAQASLERAQRIEPRNYFIWSALAGLYLDQKNYDQAESVAQKSNSLARGNVYVELENWKVIARARDARGDDAGALQARLRTDEIEQLIARATPPQ